MVILAKSKEKLESVNLKKILINKISKMKNYKKMDNNKILKIIFY